MLVNVPRKQGVQKPRQLTPSPLLLRRVALSIAAACLGAVTLNAQSPAATEILRREFLGRDFAVSGQ